MADWPSATKALPALGFGSAIASKPPALEIAVAKLLGDFRLDVSIAAPRGVTVLFGRSGSGKSSVINLIAGLLRPDHGHIRVEDSVLYDSRHHIDLPAHRRQLGYVFQDGRLFPHMSVVENLRYGSRRAAAHPPAIDFDTTVRILGLGPLLDRVPASLSGGERSRVAIGRALLSGARILLMDEPLAALDAARRDDVLGMLEALRATIDIPIIYVSHSFQEVVRLADTLVVLDAGRVVAMGPVADVTSQIDLPGFSRREDAAVILEASVAAHDPDIGATSLAFAGGTLHVPKIARPIGDRLRLSVRARDVALALERPHAISIQNILEGTVVGIGEASASGIDIRVAVGSAILISRITAQAMAALSLTIGRPVFVLVKGVALIERSDDSA